MDASSERDDFPVSAPTHAGLTAEIRTAIQTMSTYGATDNGLVRPVYTPAWCGAMDELASWLTAAGLSVRRDAVGNLFGRIDGSEGDSRVILTGSHLDSIVGGGNYDGVAGVVCSYVALTTLLGTKGRPRKNLELVAFCDEESSRFRSNFWGSRAIVGRIQDTELDELIDADGVTVGTAIRNAGFPTPDLVSCRRDDIDAFLELHIEQGPILESEGLSVGTVSAITGAHWSNHVVTGVGNHAGGTPMSHRVDPLQAAAEMIGQVEQIATRFSDPARGTVGYIETSPGVANAIPGSVTFSADLRHPDPVLYEELKAAVFAEFQAIGDRRGVGLEVDHLHRRTADADGTDDRDLTS